MCLRSGIQETLRPTTFFIRRALEPACDAKGFENLSYQESCQRVVSAGFYDDLNIGRDNRLLGEQSRSQQTSGGWHQCAMAHHVTS